MLSGATMAFALTNVLLVMGDNSANLYMEKILTHEIFEGQFGGWLVSFVDDFELETNVPSGIDDQNIKANVKVTHAYGLDKLRRTEECSLEPRKDGIRIDCVLRFSPSHFNAHAVVTRHADVGSPRQKVVVKGELNTGILLNVAFYGQGGLEPKIVDSHVSKINMTITVEGSQLQLDAERAAKFYGLLESEIVRRFANHINGMYREQLDIAAKQFRMPQERPESKRENSLESYQIDEAEFSK